MFSAKCAAEWTRDTSAWFDRVMSVRGSMRRGSVLVAGAVCAVAVMVSSAARAETKAPGVASLPAGKTVKTKRTTARSSRAAKAAPQGPIALMPGFAMRSDGTSVVYVELTAAPQVEEHVAKGFVIYTLKDTRIDRANNKNPLETAFYNTPVLRAHLRGVKKEPDAELVIELRAEVKPTFKVLTEKGQARLEVVFPAGQYAHPDLDPADVPPRSRALRPERAERAKSSKKTPAASTSDRARDDSRKGPKAP
jgi:hypothetical protein